MDVCGGIMYFFKNCSQVGGKDVEFMFFEVVFRGFNVKILELDNGGYWYFIDVCDMIIYFFRLVCFKELILLNYDCID